MKKEQVLPFFLGFIIFTVGLFKEDIYSFLLGLWIITILLILEAYLNLKEWIKSELKTIKPKRKRKQ